MPASHGAAASAAPERPSPARNPRRPWKSLMVQQPPAASQSALDGTRRAMVLLFASNAILFAALGPWLSAGRAPRAARPRDRTPDPGRQDPARRRAAGAAGAAREPHGRPRSDQGPGRQGPRRIATPDRDSRASAPGLAPPGPRRYGLAAGRV